jgi:DNA repair protein RadC
MTTETMRLRELTVRYSLLRNCAGLPVWAARRIQVASDVADAFAAILGDECSEVFGMLCLSTKRRVIAYHEISRGSLDSTLVHPREVFKAAILANASAIVFAHNHPSGDPTPSPDDLALTSRLVSAGTVLGIDVLDHVIIGDGRWVSLAEVGQVHTHRAAA